MAQSKLRTKKCLDSSVGAWGALGSVFVAALVLLVGCGAGSDRRQAVPGNPEDGSGVVTTRGPGLPPPKSPPKGPTVGINDVLALLVGDDDLPVSASPKLSTERRCVTSGGDAVETSTGLIDARWKDSKTTKASEVNHSLTGKNSWERRWSLSSGAVWCDRPGLGADVDWRSARLQTVAFRFDRTREERLAIGAADTGEVSTASAGLAAKGEGEATWTRVWPGLSSLFFQQELSLSMARKLTVTVDGNPPQTFNQKTKTRPGSPLEIIVQRDAVSGALVSSTIETGGVVIEDDDGQTDVFFDGVLVEWARSHCRVTDGIIWGRGYKTPANNLAEESGASGSTFKIVCNAGGCSQVIGSGDLAPDLARLCDLDDLP